MVKQYNCSKVSLPLAAFFLLLSLVLTGCSALSAPRFYTLNEESDPLADVVSHALPQYERTVRRVTDNPLPAVLHGSILECYDLQARSCQEQGAQLYWYPLCTSTIVFAVDPLRVGEVPRSWRELSACRSEVSWIYRSGAEKQFVFGAAAYGLTGEQFAAKPVLELMRSLQEAGRLSAHQLDAPVLVLSDYDALALLTGEPRRLLIVPEDGTLSFDLGLVSSTELTELPEAGALLDAGLRLPDGRYTAAVYPPQQDYTAAAHVQDVSGFLRATRSSGVAVRRQVLHTRLYTSANVQELILLTLLSVAAILFWVGSVIHRSVHAKMQVLMSAIGIQAVLWLLLRMVKFLSYPLSVSARYLWYGFYIFLLGLPLTLLWFALTMDDAEEALRFPSAMRAAASVGAGLLVLVLTNDLHQLVFRFDPSGNWEDDYHYGPGYFAIYGFCFFIFFLAVGLLIAKSIRSPRKWCWLLPLCSAALIVLYTLGYVLQLPLARQSDFTLSFIVLSMLFVEAALHTGLIPINTRYRQLFTSSPLAMQLLDRQGSAVLTGRDASMLPREIREKLMRDRSASLSWKPDTLLFSRAVRGGTVVWEEDRSALNALREQICQTNRKLDSANRLLQNEEALRRRKLAAAAQAELFDSLEDEIRERTEALSEAIRRLPQASDRHRQIAGITLLLCYIKRRCHLFFLLQESDELPLEQLSMYLDELCEFARYADVRAMNRCRPEGTLNTRCAALCYDFFYSVLSWSVQGSRSPVLGELVKRDRVLEFRLLVLEKPETLRLPDRFQEVLEQLHGQLMQKPLDEITGIYLTLPEGGNQDA